MAHVTQQAREMMTAQLSEFCRNAVNAREVANAIEKWFCPHQDDDEYQCGGGFACANCITSWLIKNQENALSESDS